MAVQRRDSPDILEAAEPSAQEHAARQLEGGEEPADEQARSSHEVAFSRMRSSSCASSIGDEPPCGSEGATRKDSAASAARSSTSSCSEAGSGACEISVERETLLSPGAEDSSADAEGCEELGVVLLDLLRDVEMSIGAVPPPLPAPPPPPPLPAARPP